ncbi:hypothetical protein J1614_008453 [Plenodomus biglobosus]|nr:hypothetical protein J1614_008453 [Plenodomus biglobosus]
MVKSSAYYELIKVDEVDVVGPKNLTRKFTDTEVAHALFTFLFASQDASSSATIWLFQIIAQGIDVLERIRAEILVTRGGDAYAPMGLAMIGSRTYTNAAVKEPLRRRPPVI